MNRKGILRLIEITSGISGIITIASVFYKNTANSTQIFIFVIGLILVLIPLFIENSQCKGKG